jgi:hypothetical protein
MGDPFSRNGYSPAAAAGTKRDTTTTTERRKGTNVRGVREYVNVRVFSEIGDNISI